MPKLRSYKVGIGNKDLRAFHATLAHAVEKVFGRDICPCCGVGMRRPNRKSKRATVTDRTVAHNQPVAFGGNPKVWVYACHRCNQQQGKVGYRAWSAYLTSKNDPRAPRVRALAEFVEEWLCIHKIKDWIDVDSDDGQGPEAEEDRGTGGPGLVSGGPDPREVRTEGRDTGLLEALALRGAPVHGAAGRPPEDG